MGFTWKEIVPNDHYCLRAAEKMNSSELIYITQLYQPLIGPLSTSLYVTFYHECRLEISESSMGNHRGLMSMMGTSLHKIIDAREKLEAVGLLKTIKVEGVEAGNHYYEYELLSPMPPSQFFDDDMLNIMLLNRVGKQKYRQLRERLLGKSKAALPDGERTDLTKSFDQIFRAIIPSELLITPGSETDQFLAEVEGQFPTDPAPLPVVDGDKRLRLTETNPDFSFLEAALPKTWIKDRKLSLEIRQVIQKLAFLYNLNDLQLSYFLQDPYICGDDNEIHPGRLKKVVYDWYQREHQGNPMISEPTPPPKEKSQPIAEASLTKEDAHKQALATVSPLTLIEQYQAGSKVSPADVKIVEELTQSYRLPSGVINVLLEYVMMTNNKQLPRALIFKIASHWKRLKIEDVEQALGQAKQLYQETNQPKANKANPARQQRSNPRRPATTKTDVPEWVARQGSTPANNEELTEEQKRQAEELLRALGELKS
ncbi:hypothetical protein BEP19_05045 [Ammoniphilus oxalaticus]|uniref:Uncharacterized protein n=1 Tax=Ammoniphilus oxalaticus TaxID=66863 RepID=A0A419SIQ3_9BACL|nr:DnaD domain protein [Ammoniphilus oxalaticus]RKD23798.1 hypothetical protein BEP19_05045 [Ammoniphilus oxalaticus]